jgi:hypothetical protein
MSLSLSRETGDVSFVLHPSGEIVICDMMVMFMFIRPPDVRRTGLVYLRLTQP